MIEPPKDYTTGTLTLRKKHFNRAINAKWDTCSCLLAQAIEEKMGPVVLCGASSAKLASGDIIRFPNDISAVVELFDAIHAWGDETKAPELLAKLPLKIKYQRFQ